METLHGSNEYQRATQLPISTQCSRVNQLDAVFLDDELNASLKSHFVRIFKYLPIDFVMKYEIEIDYALRLLVYYFSIFKDGGLNGDQLQNIKFTKTLSRKQKLLYFMASILLPYLFRKLLRFMTDRGFQDCEADDRKYRLYIFCTKLSILWRIVSLVHLIVFLCERKYRSLLDRALDIKLKYINVNLNRFVSFDFMNQQIVWNDISNFLLFVLPLINFHKISLLVRQQINNVKFLFNAHHTALKHMDGDGENNGQKQIANTHCPLCGLSPMTIPCKANCGAQHLFCYYCLTATLLNQGGRMRCPLCYELITQHKNLLPLP